MKRLTIEGKFCDIANCSTFNCNGSKDSVAIAALRQMQEREANEPLTADELRQMYGQPVWVRSGSKVFACIAQPQRALSNNVFAHGFHDYAGIRLVHDVTFTFMASDVDCYRRPPKGE